MFLSIPRVLDREQLAGIRAVLYAPDAPWVDGRVTAGHQGAPVKKNQQLDENSSAARSLGHMILTQLERNPLFVSATLPNQVYPPLFNRYAPGMYFGTHVDGAVRNLPGAGRKLRTDLSATLFLAPPDDYEGGELLIDDHAGQRAFKLDAGDMIVYPTTATHRVTPVTRGMRVATVFWIQSLVRDPVKREQLFELDGTVQRLTESGADADSLVRLAGHYHNLLRLWTET
jgi:PKHD-type hydroxylase